MGSGGGGLSSGVKRQGAWSWPLTPSSTEVKMRGAIPPLPQIVFMVWSLVKHIENFTFYSEQDKWGATSCLLWLYGPSQILTYLLTYLLLHGASHFRQADSHPAFLTVAYFLQGTRRFITVLIKAHHWTLTWASWNQLAPSIAISLRSILMLSSHLPLRLPTGLFPSILPIKTL
jgi:hypothetical protein